MLDARPPSSSRPASGPGCRSCSPGTRDRARRRCCRAARPSSTRRSASSSPKRSSRPTSRCRTSPACRHAPARADRPAVDLRRLVAGFLRMAPDVAIVGEVRDREALPLLLTLSSGVKGFTTIHAGSARQALTRLRFICQLADTGASCRSPRSTPSSARRSTSSCTAPAGRRGRGSPRSSPSRTCRPGRRHAVHGHRGVRPARRDDRWRGPATCPVRLASRPARARASVRELLGHAAPDDRRRSRCYDDRPAPRGPRAAHGVYLALHRRSSLGWRGSRSTLAAGRRGAAASHRARLARAGRARRRPVARVRRRRRRAGAARRRARPTPCSAARCPALVAAAFAGVVPARRRTGCAALAAGRAPGGVAPADRGDPHPHRRRSGARSPRRCSRSAGAAPGRAATGLRAAQREWLLSTDFERTVAVLKAQARRPHRRRRVRDAARRPRARRHRLDRRLAALAEDRIQDTQGRKDARAKQAGVRFARRFVLIVPVGMALAGMSVGNGRSAYQTPRSGARGRGHRHRRRVLALGGPDHAAARRRSGCSMPRLLGRLVAWRCWSAPPSC